MQDTDTPAGSLGGGCLVEDDIGTVGVVAVFIVRHLPQEAALDFVKAEAEETRTEGLYRKLCGMGVLSERFVGIENAGKEAHILDTDS